MNPVTLVKHFLIGLIRVYQWTLGPVLPMSCRFEPTCSHYASETIARYGALRGGLLALRRLARCNPWGGAGHDPVPDLDEAPLGVVRRGRPGGA